MIVSKSYPFRMAEKDEKYYKYIYRNSPEDFTKYWKRMGDRFSKKGIKTELISMEFKTLIFKLLCYEPKDRMTIEELEKDPWFNSVDYSRNKTRKELAFNYMQIIKEKEQKSPPPDTSAAAGSQQQQVPEQQEPP